MKGYYLAIFLLSAFFCVDSLALDSPWDDGYYADAAILAQYYESVQEVNVDFSRLLFKLKVKGVFDVNSVRVFESDRAGNIGEKALPSKFVPDKSFAAATNAYGQVVFRVRGEKDLSKATKTYRFFFDIIEHGKKSKADYQDIGDANLIPDPSFEGGDARRIPKSPHFRPIGENRIHDLTMGRSGIRSIRFTSPHAKSAPGLWVTSDPAYKKQGIRIKPSTSYRFLFWIKGENVELLPENRYKLIVHAGAYWYKGFENSKEDYIDHWKSWGRWKYPKSKSKFSFDWKKIEAILLSPSNAKSVKFVFKTSPGTGYVWLDDCLLTPTSIPELIIAYKIRK